MTPDPCPAYAGAQRLYAATLTRTLVDLGMSPLFASHRNTDRLDGPQMLLLGRNDHNQLTPMAPDAEPAAEGRHG